jgi:hypothetical protein
MERNRWHTHARYLILSENWHESFAVIYRVTVNICSIALKKPWGTELETGKIFESLLLYICVHAHVCVCVCVRACAIAVNLFGFS